MWESFEVSRFGIVDGAAPERDALDNIPKPAEVYLPPAYEGTIPAGAIHVARSVPVVLANSSSSISTENTTTTSPRTFSPSPTIEQLSSPPPPSSHPFKRFVQRLLRKSHNGQEKKRELDRAAVLDLLALQNTYAPEWFGPTQRQRRGDIEAGRAEGEENIVTSLPPYSEVGLPPTGRTVPEYMFFCGFRTSTSLPNP
ncbi:hypothetical protein FRB99_006974 [Tulasnella sp. 403]|nr:hypothetical protein FRB99_006974 [Tulasnella sp. 403]